MGVEIQLFEVGAYRSDARASLKQNELPLLLEEVSLAKRMRMVF
jgi:hypothetical protein